MQLHNIVGSFHNYETTSLLLKHLTDVCQRSELKITMTAQSACDCTLALLIKAINSFLFAVFLCNPYLFGKKGELWCVKN